jgi:hypothetical protein
LKKRGDGNLRCFDGGKNRNRYKYWTEGKESLDFLSERDSKERFKNNGFPRK